jgi:hypothetical protein
MTHLNLLARARDLLAASFDVGDCTLACYRRRDSALICVPRLALD